MIDKIKDYFDQQTQERLMIALTIGVAIIAMAAISFSAGFVIMLSMIMFGVGLETAFWTGVVTGPIIAITITIKEFKD